MLPSRNRMRRHQDFGVAVRRGRRVGRPTLVVHLYRCPDERRYSSSDGDGAVDYPHGSAPGPARAGFVVSKAVGRAVDRNLVKRRLRHLLRPYLSELPPGSLVVVRALPPARLAEYAELAGDLSAAFGRLLGGSPQRGAARRHATNGAQRQR